VIGHQAAKRALLLLAIETGLRGVLIASSGGSDEAMLARSFGALLSAAQSEPSIDPGRESWVVDLPLNITEDRLLGELDLERTIATGKREISTGLLARANRRVLIANDINLLDPGIATHVAQALDSRQVSVEREGISVIHDADFLLVGIFNSAEGDPSSLLRDRVGLILDTPVDWSPDERAEIVERAFRFDRDPVTFAEEFARQTAQLICDIKDARKRLPRVRVSKSQVRRISQIALRLGVEGNRADVFALKAARASAALAGRLEVSEDDLVAAIQLVLVPRATTLPLPTEDARERTEPARPETREDNGAPESADRDSIPGSIESLIIEAIDTRVPRELLSAAEPRSRGSRAGKRFKASPASRGRYVRATANRERYARVAIDATLRASAPHQRSRRQRSQPAAESMLDGVLKKPGVKGQTRHVRIEPGDLRYKEFKHRSGILFLFAVDASGSMALNRMAHAKGALIRLLQRAYVHRDRVALISFRGSRSDVLLAPTRSVELARRLIDALPAGGGTPLSAGVLKAIEMARLARLRESSQTMLVLFTDGRANVGLEQRRSISPAPTIGEELKQLGALLHLEEIQSVVVDTKARFVANGEAEALARTLGAHYVYLPRADAAALYDAISSITRRPTEN
jgi:magnesium chelatase subunit D